MRWLLLLGSHAERPPPDLPGGGRVGFRRAAPAAVLDSIGVLAPWRQGPPASG